MIQLTRLNNSKLTINSDLIKFVEQSPDTVITLLNGEKILAEPAAAGGASNADQSDDQRLTSITGQIEHTLTKEIADGDVAVHSSSEGLIISLREIGFFDTGSDEIKSSSAAAFSRIADVLRPADNNIRIEGHTDDVPIHNAHFSSNWDLSTARATATVRLLIHYGLSPERLAASGYAEYHPVSDNQSVAGRALNRRVDIVILRRRAEP